MILTNVQRIFEAASKDPGRYATNAVQFTVENGIGFATATNGRQLVRIQVVMEDTDNLGAGILLSAADLRSGWGRGKGDRVLSFDGVWKLTVGNQVSIIAQIDGQFPLFHNVIAEPSNARLMTFDVDLMIAISKAVGTKSLTFEVPEFTTRSGVPGQQVTDPIRIRLNGTGSDENLGVMMPIVVE